MRNNNGFLWNSIVDRIMGIWDDMMLDVNIQELLTKENIVLLRSAKEEVIYNLLDQLSNSKYTGNLFLIGRQGDEKYISEYPKMKIDIYVVDEGEVYSVENTKVFLDGIDVDAICFLYQLKVSPSHDNLLRIVEYVGGQGYAISRQMHIKKIDSDKMDCYLRGKSIYEALCDWYYDTRCFSQKSY